MVAGRKVKSLGSRTVARRAAACLSGTGRGREANLSQRALISTHLGAASFLVVSARPAMPPCEAVKASLLLVSSIWMDHLEGNSPMLRAISIPPVVRASALIGLISLPWMGHAMPRAEGAERIETVELPVLASATGQAPVDPDQLGFDEIVFVKRKPYSSDHYYTDINNGTSPDRFLPENGIYIYNLRTGAERAGGNGRGSARRQRVYRQDQPVLRCQEVVFDFRQDPRLRFSHLGSATPTVAGLRQISFPPEDEAEKVARWGKPGTPMIFIPVICRTARSSFPRRVVSTRFFAAGRRTWWPRLHRMDADGGNVEQLTHSPVSEFCPVVLDDGRIMYHRWEYIDKGARVGKTIWSMNPDGTRPQELYGVADDTTTVYMYPQPIPGQDHRIVCVGTCHFPQGGCLGAIMLIDFKQGDPGTRPRPGRSRLCPLGRPIRRHEYHSSRVHRTSDRTGLAFSDRARSLRTRSRWPEGSPVHAPISRQRDVSSWSLSRSIRSIITRTSPTPIRCIWSTSREDHRLVHRDEHLSCWHPLPLVARAVPPNVRSSRHPEYVANDQALCILTDVYQGMPGVERGEVKWLRVNEALPRYWDTGRRWSSSLSSSSWKASLWPRVQWGVVPVEKDGSAHFVVPANRSIFLQALDERLQGNPARADVRELPTRRGAFLHRLSRQRRTHRLTGRFRNGAGPRPGPEHSAAAAMRSGGKRR